MQQIFINTENIKSISKDIGTEIGKYEISMDNFFNELSKVEEFWIGSDFDAFISKALDEKVDFYKLPLVLKEYCKILDGFALKIESYNYFG